MQVNSARDGADPVAWPVFIVAASIVQVTKIRFACFLEYARPEVFVLSWHFFASSLLLICIRLYISLPSTYVVVVNRGPRSFTTCTLSHKGGLRCTNLLQDQMLGGLWWWALSMTRAQT